MKKLKFILVFSLIFGFTSCEVLQQATQLTTFAKCKFRLHSIENLHLAGVNIQQIKSISDLNFFDAAKLTAAITSNELPLSFVLNIQVQNPNQNQAAMNRLNWNLFIDETEITEGMITQRLLIAPNEIANMPLTLNFNLKDVLSKDAGNSLLGFVFNLVGAGNEPTNISLRAKPTLIVAGQEVVYPGFITIKNEFTSN